MFLDENSLIRQMKVAYSSGGITFANLKSGLVINASVWTTWLDNKYVSNRIKAAVMELSGILPEDGRMFSVNKSNPNPQFRIDNEIVFSILDRADHCNKPLKVTQICLLENFNVRLLQDSSNVNMKRSDKPFYGQLHGVNEVFFEMVNKKQVNYDIESEPTGPSYNNSVQSGVFWTNETCKFMIMPAVSKFKDVLVALSVVKFGD
jgi:hypothetical protein